jgi:hypothetical protein
MGMKNILILLLVAVGFSFCAQAQSRRIEPLPLNCKKKVIINSNSNSATPDTSAAMTIVTGDSSSIGHIWFKSMTDTGSVGARKKSGLLIVNKIDTCLWIYTGVRWKKAGV